MQGGGVWKLSQKLCMLRQISKYQVCRGVWKFLKLDDKICGQPLREALLQKFCSLFEHFFSLIMAAIPFDIVCFMESTHILRQSCISYQRKIICFSPSLMLDPVSNLLLDDDVQYFYISRTMTLLPLALTLASLIVVTNSRQEFITEPEHQVGTFTSVHAPGSVFQQKR